MLNPCNEVFLRGTGVGRNKYRVVAADVADHFRPIAAVKCERDSLCGADSRLDDEQVRARRMNGAQQVSDGTQMVYVAAATDRQFVAPGGPYCAQLTQVTADAGLCRAVTLGRKRGHQRALRFGRSLQE